MDTIYELITTREALNAACERLDRVLVLGVDCETTHLDPRRGLPRLIQIAESHDRVHIIDLDRFDRDGALDPLRRLLQKEDSVKVLFNAKFDYQWLLHHYGIRVPRPWDAMLADILLTSGHRRALQDVVYDRLDIPLDKSQQVSNWEGELQPAQLEYAASDAAILLPLYNRLRADIIAAGLRRAAVLEFDCVEAIAELELNGMPVDRPSLESLLRALDEAYKVKGGLLHEALAPAVPQQTLFGLPDINLDSTQEVAELLKRLGVPLKESTRDHQLADLADQYPVVQMLRDYREAAKLAPMLRSLVEAIDPLTDRIHADFHQIGASTGRMSVSNPNLQQVPAEQQYGSCFRAPEGRVILTLDYSQIEIRILAYLSKDPAFLAALKSGQDFHRQTASDIFHIPVDAVSADQRSFSKTMNFGVIYDMSSQRLARQTGLSDDEAEALIRGYFSTYSVVERFLKGAAQSAVRNSEARTLSGRRILYHFDHKDRKACASVARAGRNAPIQGSSADMTKRALFKLTSAFRDTDVKIVNVVHDEIVIECPDEAAGWVADYARAGMLEAAYEFTPDVPIEVGCKSAETWVK
jgi:DNA polymerase I-like protein with 3'-5' exonuclease and polymerase domains